MKNEAPRYLMNAWVFLFAGRNGKKAMPSGIAFQKRKGKTEILFSRNRPFVFPFDVGHALFVKANG